jgi:hypothetical protein
MPFPLHATTVKAINHHSSRAHEVYVGEGPKREAVKRLNERIEAGESAYDILGIDKEHKYYVSKLVAGLVPISYAIYGRIMNLDVEDDFSE